MPQDELICPNCRSQGMNGYLYCESRVTNDGKYQWLFYNIIPKENTWKCWALLDSCGCKVHTWYDPCNCCFNPCDHTPDVVTYINGQEVRREKDCATGTICCIFLMFVIYFIYAIYFMLFFWFDLYFYFCGGSPNQKAICTGNGNILVPENSYYWEDDTNLFTEQYWCINFPYLFVCKSCNYYGKSFKDFIYTNNQAYSVPVNIITSKDAITNPANSINN